MIKWVYCSKCSKQLLASKYRGIEVRKIRCKECQKDEQRK